MASLKDTLRLVHEELASRYGKLEIVSVQGVPKGQRVRFVDQGKPVQCVIKVSSAQSHGRISFQVLPDGTFGGGLLDSDLVAVVGPSDPNDQGLVLSMYDQPTLLEAFTANREALKQSGNSQGGQSWLAPFHEEGRGFGASGTGFRARRFGLSLWRRRHQIHRRLSARSTVQSNAGRTQPKPLPRLWRLRESALLK